jgi:hypothetical protein
MRGVVTPAANWPIGRRIVLLDAWLNNPREVKVTRHWNAEHIGAEDDRGIVYYAKTDRIEGFTKPPVDPDFADILG